MQLNSKYHSLNSFFYILLLCFIVSGSCKSIKNASKDSNEPSYDFYCSGSDYLANSDFFRIHYIGESVDQPTSMKKAIQMAQGEMAKIIQLTLNGTMKKYITSKAVLYDEELKENVNMIASQVSEESILKVIVICEESIKTLNGLYKTYVVLEISANEVLKELRKNISETSQFEVTINVFEFEKIFEKEIEKIIIKPGLQ